MEVKLYDHQINSLEKTKNMNRVAYYHDMGLGKTFTGAEKLIQLGTKINLIICQKSKVQDWIDHFIEYYSQYFIYDLTKPKEFDKFINYDFSLFNKKIIGVINYDLIFRRPDLNLLKDFTLLLDESSLIQNEDAKRSKFILNLKLKNVILLSGTPTGGKYERLWSQLHLLGWKISKKMFYNHYVEYHYEDSQGFPLMIIDGYKNEERLKKKMNQYGCDFLKTKDVFTLPQQIHQEIKVKSSKQYRKFKKNSIIEFDGIELIGNTTLTKMLYERQLCGQYNEEKLNAFQDLIESTDDRLIVFYNFYDELEKLCKIAWDCNKPVSVVNGKQKDLLPYENVSNSVTFIQYQAGAMGLNLQKASKIIYFTPPLSSEFFEQSKKRIHRIGQNKPCFYYYLICKNSIEEKIYKTLAMRKDYTERLFENEKCY